LHHRRRFSAIVFGAAITAAWSLQLLAQPATPVVGFLAAPAAASYAKYAEAFRQGLKEAGFASGQNVVIEYRWADGRYERLRGMADDLVGRKVAAIVAVGGAPVALAAKSATATTPIIFVMGDDPIRLGLVHTLSQPGGNATGVSLLAVALEGKRLELLHELVPKNRALAMLINPTSPQAEAQSKAIQSSAHVVGRKLHILRASNETELEAAFATFAEGRMGGLLVGADTFFTSQAKILGALAARFAVPAISPWRDHAAAGMLMSYGPSLADAYRLSGVYTGRILKGAKPADLPVIQPTKFELVLNLKAAKQLGIALSRDFLMRADEVIQ
jgi:putative ABC transport system substrate-binding protein